jgi:hypothetical protein
MTDVADKSLETIRSRWDEIDIFMIEICSVKRYTREVSSEMYEIQHEFPKHDKGLSIEFSPEPSCVQDAQEIEEDIKELQRLCDNRPIVFQGHFRFYPGHVGSVCPFSGSDLFHKLKMT